jgi:23S rRNA (guanine745-N1)-methyltransferase
MTSTDTEQTIPQANDILICPVCQQPLPELAGATDKHGAARSRGCANGHSFDRARQGYFNLLLVNQKRSLNPGDNIEMVRARQQFLNGGYYQAIADAINTALIPVLADRANTSASQTLHIADSGCGEGYYTASLAQQLTANHIHHHLYGIDISRDAVRTACQRSKQIDWLVASGSRLPFQTGSLDAILSVFTPTMADRWAELLKPEAPVWLVTPAQQHLQELRQHIYTDVRSDSYDPTDDMIKQGFERVGSSEHSSQVFIPAAALPDLLTMTPHGWRITAEKRQQVLALNGLELTISVRISQFSAHSSNDQPAPAENI